MDPGVGNGDPGFRNGDHGIRSGNPGFRKWTRRLKRDGGQLPYGAWTADGRRTDGLVTWVCFSDYSSVSILNRMLKRKKPL